MDRWVGKVAVVTGGSLGIGAGISKKLTEQGLKVVSLSRSINPTLNDSIKNDKIHQIECDVTDLEKVVESFKWINDNIGVVQILINNAGLINFSSFIDGDPRDWAEVFNVNVMGLLNCTRQVLFKLNETKLEGHIVHMNSVSGHYCVIGQGPLVTNVKSASKKAVTCLNDCMRKELLQVKLPIKVTSLSPGFVDTGNEMKIIRERCKDFPKLQIEDVVDAVVYILGTPPKTHVQELIIRPLGEDFC